MRSASEVLSILKDPFAGGRIWTMQGFGMLRTYLDPDEVERLHIWDTGKANAEVSTVHNHAWDFESLIYSGRLANQRYIRDSNGREWRSADIRPGECGGLISNPEMVRLSESPREFYQPGSTYRQEATELHESLPTPGTVTVIKRTFHNDRTLDVATVAWKAGGWVTAEPRRASEREIMDFVLLARERWQL